MRNDPTVVSALELAKRESRRVAAHILRAEARARRRPARHLDGLRRTVRALLLDELARYRRQARFPKNRDFDERTPYFIDRNGTRCAMAHLLEVGGERELVRKIARERNNARVSELANEARLLAWLDAAGLTVEEAAAIQPSYCATATECVCWPAVGVLEARLLSGADRYPLIASATVEVIHGELPLFSVGEVVDVAAQTMPISETLVVPVSSFSAERPSAPYPYLVGFFLSPDGTFDCNVANPAAPVGAVGYPEVPALTKEQYIELVQSETCRPSLAEMDEAWTQVICDPVVSPEIDAGADAGADPGESDHVSTVRSDESSCSVPAGSAGEPTTLGIFVAIVTALAARRQRRATSKRSTSSFE
jgi:MYXO-CTERM domain-containing protein